MIYEGTYPSLIQGVSQQTPQERLDGQLGAQVNMLSDPVNGLRRRTGFKFHGRIDIDANSKFELIQLAGEHYIQCVSPAGKLIIIRFNGMEVIHNATYPYLVNTNKSTIRSTISRNQSYILNTEKVPTKVYNSAPSTYKLTPEQNARRLWISVYGQLPGFVGRHDRVTIKNSNGLNVEYNINYPDLLGEVVTPAMRASSICDRLVAESDISSNYTVTVAGTVVMLVANSGIASTTVDVTGRYTSNTPNTVQNPPTIRSSTQTLTRSQLPSGLSSEYNGHYRSIGNTTFVYDHSSNLWVVDGVVPNTVNPKSSGWIRIISGAFSKAYTVSIEQGSMHLNFTVTTNVSLAAEATPEYVATQLASQMTGNTTFASNFSLTREGTTIAVLANNQTTQMVITASGGDTYLTASGGSVIRNKDLLPPSLPTTLDGYILGVGTVGNLAYYKFNRESRTWKESGFYEQAYTIQDTPMFWYYDYVVGQVVVDSLDIKGRTAGDADNNPEPSFIGFGITGIGAYQSRLILLNGSYVNMSKSNDPSVFMRTTVTELLDDDPIEISSTSLSNAQFEYAIPYNKDLILFSSTQQAVIPANNTVLTPKSAVIYPSTQTEASLAVRPATTGRSLYYTYQRGSDYYQVAELIPSQYTDAQYTPQNLMDHLPLYATGVCTGIAGSSTNNMVAMSSDSPEVLINQFVWQGDQRSIMGFHKWVLPRDVVDVAFIQEYNVLFTKDTSNRVLVLTTNTQLNQLKDKPVPFLDIYQYVDLNSNGMGTLPFVPTGDLVAVVYNDVNYRHMEVKMTRTGNTVSCPEHAGGTIAVGVRYESSFTLTPPYLKDENGKVLAGVKSTVHSFPLTFKGTGEFQYVVHDFVGAVASVDTSAAIWSEVSLGYTWISSISTSVIPVRSRLDGLTCTIRTTSTTDLNLTTAGYVLRTAQKHRARR